MKQFFKDLLEYNHHFNQALITLITENQEKLSEKCIRLFSHILNAHNVWNSRIEKRPQLYAIWEIHSIEDFKKMEDKNYNDSLLVLEKFELSDIMEYTNTKGESFVNTIRDILFHCINHSTYHRAQIATEFRQAGIEPLITDYIFYKRTH